MSSTRGPHFWTASTTPIIRQFANELSRALPLARPADPHALFVVRRSENTGRGVFVKDQCTVPHGAHVGAYWGLLTDSPCSDSHYLLELPEPNLGSDGPGPCLFVDAHLACLRSDLTPDQVAFFNHKCEDPTCAGRWSYSDHSILPIFAAYTRRSLRGGTELSYNYDGHLRTEPWTYTMDLATAVARGRTDFPCRCVGTGPCPNGRFFP
jgi:hypothetical protein